MGDESMKKIKIRDTHVSSSIANSVFSIQKGQIVSVPDDFFVDKSVFDLVEEDGKPVEIKSEISDMEVKALLDMPNLSNLQAKLRDMNAQVPMLTKIAAAEMAGKKRKNWLEWFASIPVPMDQGIKITKEGMLLKELMSIKGVNDKLAALMIEKYKDKEGIIERLTNNKKDIEVMKGMTHEIIEAMLKHFKLTKDKVTSKKSMFGG